MNSSASSRPDSKIPPYKPFLLDDISPAAPTELGCDVTYESSVLRYQVSFQAKEILSETLTLLDQDTEVLLIDRSPDGEVQGTLIEKSEANRLYVKEMQPNVAVLSKLAQHGPHKGKESVQSYYRAICNATRREDYLTAVGTTMYREPDLDRFADDPKYRDWIMRHLMRAADVGIMDVQTRREPVEIPPMLQMEIQRASGGSEYLPDNRVVVSFVHKGAKNGVIEFEDESSGTKKLFNLASDWWRIANESATIFADELSASLHPRLLDQLIRAANDPSQRVESQLVFATHDTGLLEGRDGLPPALRRDQVYFTKKNIRGESELYALAEFKEDARPVHNIRKRYMSGLYGALPSAERLSL